MEKELTPGAYVWVDPDWCDVFRTELLGFGPGGDACIFYGERASSLRIVHCDRLHVDAVGAYKARARRLREGAAQAILQAEWCEAAIPSPPATPEA